MSDETRNNLTKDKIQQLLAAVGKQQDAPADQLEAQEYDWKQPHFFNSRQEKKLNDFAAAISADIQTELGRFFQEDFEAKVAEITQHYAQKFISELFTESKKDYYLVLNDEKELSCGCLILSTSAVQSWLKLLLGESETKENDEGQLSQLEESLLNDVASCLGKIITNTGRQLNLKPTKKVLYENFSLDLSDSEELCKISFEIKQSSTEENHRTDILLPSSRLLPIVGAARNLSNLSPEKAKNTILEYTKELPIVVKAEFARTELSFEQILALQKGDILMLDKKINKPFDLIVEGKTRFLARPVKSGGKIAAQIVTTNPKKR